ncbi:coenzyme A pyrophosphatase [Alishewanella longhuensis]|uniref:Coenzyme A pyrophosphatase n=1 Tax=Alishewanella longhuensis TaxID=1091037 RepID=A0ABQ3KZ43_9ALTE|nr:CoA pyrophosphatase [Alishewanella longhuensis]GHG71679.1 coenzyme A pyrophosphatase [Alishewanella longhuensis]
MQANQFKSRFLLQQATPATVMQLPSGMQPRQSAVLVPIVDYGDRLSLLFTQRALHLNHHPGQISFPGGKLEANETPAAAALRETEEEIGVKAAEIELLGQLQSYNTLTGFQISPWVGVLPASAKISIDPQEVIAVFEVPLSYFIEPTNRHQLWLPWQDLPRQLHFMPYQDKLIWGATAAIIQQLVQQIA